jgi:tetratricopeptide (TPR) repeat protein
MGYRARRFVKRNRLGVAAATLIFLSLAAGLAASLWQSREAQAARELAEQRYRDVRELANALLDDIDGLLLTVPGATHARRALVERALGYLEGLAADGDDDPFLLLELGAGHERIAEILGSPYEPNLGDLPGATRQAERALELRQRAAVLRPDHTEVRLGLASSQLLLAALAYATSEDLVGLKDTSAEVIAQLEPLMLEPTARAEAARSLVFAVNLNGDAHNSLQDFAAAAERHRQALEVVQTQLAEGDRTDAFWRRVKAITEMKLAHAEWWLEADPEAVIASMQGALEELEQLNREDPGNARIMRLLAHAHANVVNVVAFERDIGEALPFAKRTIELGEQLMAVDPSNAQARRDTAGWQRMARNLYETGQYWDEADREVQRALESYQTLMREAPGNRSLQADWEFTQCERAIGLLRGWEAGHRAGAYGDTQRCAALAPCMAVLPTVEAGSPPQPREVDRYERLRNLYMSCG